MSKNILQKYTWGLVAVLLVALAVNHHLVRAFPSLSPWLSMLIILAHILGPLYILDRLKLNPRDFNLYANGLETVFDKILGPKHQAAPDYKAIRHDLFYSGLLLIAILIPYCLAYYAFFYLKTQNSDYELTFSLHMPPTWGLELLTQIFVVALPEEFFYRGFLQSSLQRRHSPIKAILITNIIFALSHFVGGLAPHRLLTFFPGLVFSCLVYRQKSLLSAILFHAIFNLVGQILAASLILTPL